MAEQIEDVLARMQQQFQNKFDIFQHSNPEKTSQTIINRQIVHHLNTNQHGLLKSYQNHDKISKDLPTAQKIKGSSIQDDAPSISSKENNISQRNLQKSQNSEDNEEDNDQQYQQEQSQDNYMQLSNKLERALNKIQQTNNKTQMNNKNDLYSRFQFYQKKKQKQLQLKKHQVEAKKFYGVKEKPQINHKSKTMMIERNLQPIYKRFEKLIEQKKKKQQQSQQLKKKKEEQQYQKFITEYQQHIKSSTNIRSSDDFYTEMMDWKQKKTKQICENVQKMKKKELEGATFQPTLNSKSKKIIQNKNRVPIYERQIKPKTIYQQVYTFKPKINKRKVQ